FLGLPPPPATSMISRALSWRTPPIALSALRLQPLKHGPRCRQVIAIIGEDLVHQLGPPLLVSRLDRFDVLRHRPVAAVLLLLPLEADVPLDLLQAVAGERQGNALLCDREQVEEVPANAIRDAVAIPEAVNIHFEASLLVV